MPLLLALLVAAVPPPQEAQFRPPAVGRDPRSQRPWVFSAELGWNGLAGVGLTVARHLHPHASIEAGAGFTPEGAKVGFRARYNLLAEEWTPFFAAGFLYGVGSELSDSRAKYRIGPSPYLQLVAGVEYQSRAGLNLLLAAGYARLLRQNLTVVSGAPTEDDLAKARFVTGGGPVLSASIGRAF